MKVDSTVTMIADAAVSGLVAAQFPSASPTFRA
jgi:hypothetical protein